MLVRAQFALDQLPRYGSAIHNFDAGRDGIPVRPAPGDPGEVRSLPWLSVVPTTGDPVDGPAPVPGLSTRWWPVDGGWVNQSDFTG